MRPEVSLVVPVFQEARVIASTIAASVAELESLGRDFEIVLVDDGSTDDSLRICRAAAERDGRIRVEAFPRNRGKGAAVRHGVLASTGAYVVFTDADLSTPLEELRGFLGALDSGYDVVLGNRRAPGSRITRHQPWLRERLGIAFTLLTRCLLAPGVHDFTCGFKAFRRAAADAIFERSTLDGWAFDAELVVIAQERGLELAQVPVSWHDEKDSKVRVGSAVARSLADLLRIRWKRARGAYR